MVYGAPYQRILHHGGPVYCRQLDPSLLLGIVVFLIASMPLSVQAEIKVLHGVGSHLLGQHDTKDDAIRLATEAAKRDALEQVATYLESITVSTNFDISRDEIRTYTAGVVNVLDQDLTISAAGDQVTFQVEITAQVDTDDVAEAVRKLPEHQAAREELASLRAEVDQLQEELERTNHVLAGNVSSDDASEMARHRTDLLNQMQSHALVQQAWSDWMMMGGSYGWPYGYDDAASEMIPGILAWAGRLNPNSPHVPITTTTMATHAQAPVPPAPPQAPAPPGTVQRGQAHRRLHSMLPQQVPTRPPLPSRISPGVPDSSYRPARPAAGAPPPQRLRPFLPPPAQMRPPTGRGIKPSSWPPSHGQVSPAQPAPRHDWSRARRSDRLPQSRGGIYSSAGSSKASVHAGRSYGRGGGRRR